MLSYYIHGELLALGRDGKRVSESSHALSNCWDQNAGIWCSACLLYAW